MKLKQKKRAIKEIHSNLNLLFKGRDQLDVLYSKIKGKEKTDINFLLKLNERNISSLKEQIDDLKSDVDTWAYTITGNIKAEVFFWAFLKIIYNFLTKKEVERYDGINEFIPYELHREIINNRCYEDLVEFASRQDSRLAFMVLGVVIMKYGAKMTEELRELILKYSDWSFERDQLENKRDRQERKKFLLDFREKIKDYQDGVETMVPVVPLTSLLEDKLKDDSLIDRRPIDYKIISEKR